MPGSEAQKRKYLPELVEENFAKNGKTFLPYGGFCVILEIRQKLVNKFHRSQTGKDLKHER